MSDKELLELVIKGLLGFCLGSLVGLFIMAYLVTQ